MDSNLRVLKGFSGCITFNELTDAILKLSDDDKNNSISIYDPTTDEYYGVSCMAVVEETDVLDKGSFVLVMNKK
jgi:hypothetical protein